MKLNGHVIILCLLGIIVESEFLLLETLKSNGESAYTPSENYEIDINKQQAKVAEKDYHCSNGRCIFNHEGLSPQGEFLNNLKII